MRLAAIDVGTNSVHMVIADVNRDGNIDVVDRVKETVRLGGAPSRPERSARKRWTLRSAP